MTHARETLDLHIEHAVANLDGSALIQNPLEKSLTSLCERISLLDDEAPASARRAMMDAVSATLEQWLDPQNTAAGQLRDASWRYARSLRTLRKLIVDLQCIPLGSQRLDHRLKQLEWAIRRHRQLTDELAASGEGDLEIQDRTVAPVIPAQAGIQGF